MLRLQISFSTVLKAKTMILRRVRIRLSCLTVPMIPSFTFGGDDHEMYIKSPAGDDYLEQCQTMEDEASMSPLCQLHV